MYNKYTWYQLAGPDIWSCTVHLQTFYYSIFFQKIGPLLLVHEKERQFLKSVEVHELRDLQYSLMSVGDSMF